MAVLDLELARGGDAAMDLGVMAVSDPDLLKEVLVGYAPDAERAAILELLIPFYVFLRRLAAAEYKLGVGDTKGASHVLTLLHTDPIPGR